MVNKNIIYYSCEGGIDKSVPRDHRLSSLGKPRDPIGDPRAIFSLLYTYN